MTRSPFSPMTRAEFIQIMTTGGAGTQAEAEALLDAYLTEFVGELADDAQKWARGAAVKKVGGMFPGQTGINFAHEVADDIVAAVFARDQEDHSYAEQVNAPLREGTVQALAKRLKEGDLPTISVRPSESEEDYPVRKFRVEE